MSFQNSTTKISFQKIRSKYETTNGDINELFLFKKAQFCSFCLDTS